MDSSLDLVGNDAETLNHPLSSYQMLLKVFSQSLALRTTIVIRVIVLLKTSIHFHPAPFQKTPSQTLTLTICVANRWPVLDRGDKRERGQEKTEGKMRGKEMLAAESCLGIHL